MNPRLPAVLILALWVVPATLSAQRWGDDEDTTRGEPSHFAINLTVHNTGISIGNAPRINGLRLNFRDAGLERVIGVNLTIWSPAKPLSGTVTGLALGVLGPGADEINGLAFGLGGVVAGRRLRGVAVGGLGVVSNRDISAITLAGLGAVANGDFTGLGLAGLGVVANGNFRGIGLSGLGVVADHDFSGFALSGLGVVANHDFTGIAISGLGAVANGEFRGIGFGLVGTVANGNLRGVAIGGIGTVANGQFTGIGVSGVGMVGTRGISGLAVGVLGGVASDGVLRGGAVGGYMIRIREIRGAALAVVRTKTNTLHGVSIAGYNQVRRQQFGLTIGLVNYARELHGVQLGVINIAGNNRGIARVLPVVNAHLGR